jgi:hypothetical protein
MKSPNALLAGGYTRPFSDRRNFAALEICDAPPYARKKRSWQADPSSCHDLYPETKQPS